MFNLISRIICRVSCLTRHSLCTARILQINIMSTPQSSKVRILGQKVHRAQGPAHRVLYEWSKQTQNKVPNTLIGSPFMCWKALHPRKMSDRSNTNTSVTCFSRCKNHQKTKKKEQPILHSHCHKLNARVYLVLTKLPRNDCSIGYT